MINVIMLILFTLFFTGRRFRPIAESVFALAVGTAGLLIDSLGVVVVITLMSYCNLILHISKYPSDPSERSK